MTMKNTTPIPLKKWTAAEKNMVDGIYLALLRNGINVGKRGDDWILFNDKGTINLTLKSLLEVIHSRSIAMSGTELLVFMKRRITMKKLLVEIVFTPKSRIEPVVVDANAMCSWYPCAGNKGTVIVDNLRRDSEGRRIGKVIIHVHQIARIRPAFTITMTKQTTKPADEHKWTAIEKDMVQGIYLSLLRNGINVGKRGDDWILFNDKGTINLTLKSLLEAIHSRYAVEIGITVVP